MTGLLARAPGHGTSGDARPRGAAGRRRALVWCACPTRRRRRCARGCRWRSSWRWCSRSRSRSAAAGDCSGSASTTTSACTWPGPSGCAAASARRRTPATRWARTGWPSPPRRFPGSASARPSSGEIFAIGVLSGLTALGALRSLGPVRRTLGRLPRRPALPGRLLLRPGRLQGDRRGALRPRLRARPARDRTPPRRRQSPFGALGQPRGLAGLGAPRTGAAGPGRRHLLLLQLRRARLADRDRRPLEPAAARGAAGAARRGRYCASCCARRP